MYMQGALGGKIRGKKKREISELTGVLYYIYVVRELGSRLRLDGSHQSRKETVR